MLFPLRSQTGKAQLIMFPPAGGNASIFSALCSKLDPDWSVFAHQTPGRGMRHTEPVITSIDDLAEDVIASLQALPKLPTAFFGHSFGAIAAFEVLRRCAAMRMTMPVHLFVSGCMSPLQVERDSTRWEKPATCSLDALFEYAVNNGGVDPAFMPFKQEFLPFMPSMQAEYSILHHYEMTPTGQFPLPLTTLVGEADEIVSQHDIRDWSAHFSSAEHHVLPGTHFFLDDQAERIAEFLNPVLHQCLISPTA